MGGHARLGEQRHLRLERARSGGRDAWAGRSATTRSSSRARRNGHARTRTRSAITSSARAARATRSTTARRTSAFTSSDNILDGNANGMLDSSKTGNDMIDGSPTILAQRAARAPHGHDRRGARRLRSRAGRRAARPRRCAISPTRCWCRRCSAQTGHPDPVRAGPGVAGRRRLGLRHARRARRGPPASTPIATACPTRGRRANGLNPNDAADRNGDTDARRLHEPGRVPEPRWSREQSRTPLPNPLPAPRGEGPTESSSLSRLRERAGERASRLRQRSRAGRGQAA